MAGFRKAKAEQAALKVGLYGPPGSGKTFTTLLIAEGLGRLTKKRVAFVDTERGTDFYVQPVPSRQVHPEGFDIDALYSRSLTEVLQAVKALSPKEHGVLVIDSITHLWEAAKASYTGPKTKVGSFPMYAWGKIKAPYKELMNLILNSPMHVFILGRQGNEFAEDEETGEVKAVGVKMKAEGETPYEPHICMRMQLVRSGKGGVGVPTAFVEKDRTGILSGQVIEYPAFDSVARPLLGLLGATQAQMPTDEEVATQDGEALEQQERQKQKRSSQLLRTFVAKLELAATKEGVEELNKKMTPDVKKQMLGADVTAARDAYLKRLAEVEQPAEAVEFATAEQVAEIQRLASALKLTDGDSRRLLGHYGVDQVSYLTRPQATSLIAELEIQCDEQSVK